ncbi:succinylglutamate desuccinylase/aspartoacylase family protein [bacterium]|nr:succinylglutamate desuccinylase/aspartoacylase family protein [bacterium]
MKNQKILFITLTHGNEAIGLNVIKKLKKINLKNQFNYIIANPLAFSENKRFINSDLNRIFPGKKNGNYEQKRAKKIIKIGKKYNYIIDLHGSVSNTGIFIIITKLTKDNLLLALKFNIQRIVIWPGADETTGSLSTFMPIGIEIESGFKNDPKIENQLKNKLINFLDQDINRTQLDEKEINKKDIFLVTGKLNKKNKKPSKLKNWIKVNNYYPLFVGGQYKNIWCYKLKKINLKNNKLLTQLK